MFTSESLHSEFKHGDVEVEMVVVVVECYCFLINIIVEPPDLVPPPFLTTVLHFYYNLHQKLQYSYGKTMSRQIRVIVVVARFR